MTKLVSLLIEGIPVEVPEGTLIVNAAKKVGIDIPVFCYHPKMEPVGMCRMCLVEIGRPAIDRATGQPTLDEAGNPKIQFGGKLETACTTPVSQGMVVTGLSEKAKAGREDILEFLLTSHPLDCPICDKGGECPLQNLTLGYGPGESRYLYDEKMHLAKQVPLGELIFLDRERCIQCARCVRFQDELVDDPVIGFYQRGRSLEIVSYSEPGFDSYWSGNTTDICPVGALTTADFRFRARPWELLSAASICSHCPVGCNLTLNVRREAVSGGERVIKRVMPRQNEGVNEIWICDKGRFGYHFAAHSDQRLNQPMVRRDGELQPATWEEALDLAAERFQQAGTDMFTLVGGRLANEDLFNIRQLTHRLGGKAALYTHVGGGELTTQIGLAPGSNLGELGADPGSPTSPGQAPTSPGQALAPPGQAAGTGSAILVVASDLEEEAPVWWLRVKQAAGRGAKLIVLNSRATKLDRAADYALRYPFGLAGAAILALLNTISAKRPDLPEGIQELARSAELRAAAKAFSEAKDAVVLYGSDGIDLAETESLAKACANLLLATGHTGRPNNGLLGVWGRANDQGAWEMGFQAQVDLGRSLEAARALYIAAADPVGDDPAYQTAFGAGKFVVVQDLYLTRTARLADVVLPAQSWTEREGSYTSGERRVQRFYPATQPINAPPPRTESPGTSRSPVLMAIHRALEGPQADFLIPALIAERLEAGEGPWTPGSARTGGQDKPWHGQDRLACASAAAVFASLAEHVPAYAGLSFQKLAETHEQWPIIGRGDLYYGGTGYENTQGLGVQLPLAGGSPTLVWPQVTDFKLPRLGMMAFPVTRLYDHGTTLKPSKPLHGRIAEPYVVLNIQDAGRLKVQEGAVVRVAFGDDDRALAAPGRGVVVTARLDPALPERVVLVPRGFGIPISGPVAVEVKRDT